MASKPALANKHVVITAGPTQEPIDPVRYISNHSSGKMGYALAEAALKLAAKVTLISGPTQLNCSATINRIDVITAEQMLKAVMHQLPSCDVFIGAAAVADYRPADSATQKLKKSSKPWSLTLVPTTDILASVSASPHSIFTVGFAAETTDLISYAKKKLTEKNLAMIIANQVDQRDRGFNTDTNEATVLWNDQQQTFSFKNKKELAIELIELIQNQYSARNQ